MGKSKGKGNRKSKGSLGKGSQRQLKTIETGAPSPLKQIRLTDAGFASRLAGKYAWHAGTSGKRAQLVHRTAEQGESSLTIPLTLQLFLRHVQLAFHLQQENMQRPALPAVIVREVIRQVAAPVRQAEGLPEPARAADRALPSPESGRPDAPPAADARQEEGQRRQQPPVLHIHDVQQPSPVPGPADMIMQRFWSILPHQTTIMALREITLWLRDGGPGAGQAMRGLRAGGARPARTAPSASDTPSAYAGTSLPALSGPVLPVYSPSAYGPAMRPLVFRMEQPLQFAVLEQHYAHLAELYARHIDLRRETVWQLTQQTLWRPQAVQRLISQIYTPEMAGQMQAMERLRQMGAQQGRPAAEAEAVPSAPRWGSATERPQDMAEDDAVRMQPQVRRPLEQDARLLYATAPAAETAETVFRYLQNYLVRETPEPAGSIAQRRASRVPVSRSVLESAREIIAKAVQVTRHLTVTVRTVEKIRNILQTQTMTLTAGVSRDARRSVTGRGEELQHARSSSAESENVFRFLQTYLTRGTAETAGGTILRRTGSVMLNPSVLENVQETVRKAVQTSRHLTVTVRTAEQVSQIVRKQTELVTDMPAASVRRTMPGQDAALLHARTPAQETEEVLRTLRSQLVRGTEEQTLRTRRQRDEQVLIRRSTRESVEESVREDVRISRQPSVTFRTLEQVTRFVQQQTHVMKDSTEHILQRSVMVTGSISRTMRHAVRIMDHVNRAVQRSVMRIDRIAETEVRPVRERAPALLNVMSGAKEAQAILQMMRSVLTGETAESAPATAAATAAQRSRASRVTVTRREIADTEAAARAPIRRVMQAVPPQEHIRHRAADAEEPSVRLSRRELGTDRPEQPAASASRRAAELARVIRQISRTEERLEQLTRWDVRTLTDIRQVRVMNRLDHRTIFRTSVLQAEEVTDIARSVIRTLNIHQPLSRLESSRSDIHARLSDLRPAQPSPAQSAAVSFVVAKRPQAAQKPPELVIEQRPAQAARMEVATKKTAVAAHEPAIKQLQTTIQKVEQDLIKAKTEWSAQQRQPDIRRLTDEVYRALTARLRFEQQRRGL